MTAPGVNVSLVATGALGLALGVHLVVSPLGHVMLPPPVGLAPTPATIKRSAPRDSLVAALVRRDPFRFARRPADIPYDPVRLAQLAAPRPPKPALALVGIVWDGGRDPTALVEGLSGVDGPRPVRRGESIAGLRVQRIARDQVVIRGVDTTWTLTVREPWR
ncbi:MAG TPA: hypothetical protein VM736_07905 [Gemmatimonadales bacterium]|nr:hypothetical protein [Gemmatimonadales bacterium]